MAATGCERKSWAQGNAGSTTVLRGSSPSTSLRDAHKRCKRGTEAGEWQAKDLGWKTQGKGFSSLQYGIGAHWLQIFTKSKWILTHPHAEAVGPAGASQTPQWLKRCQQAIPSLPAKICARKCSVNCIFDCKNCSSCCVA